MRKRHDRTAWLKGGDAHCVQPPRQVRRPYLLVLLGAPGVGKGTQAELLSDRLGACHLSTGDVFRAAKCLTARERTPTLDAATGYMRRGELVPDDIVLAMVQERSHCLRCSGGFVLDGFPRTVTQATALERLLAPEKMALTAVFNYDLPIEQVVARLSGRRSCSGCNAIFHVIVRPSRVPDVCDHCGEKLCQREDDCPESIQVRMQAYEKSTRPLIDLYSERGLLRRIPSNGHPEEIYRRTIAALLQEPANPACV